MLLNIITRSFINQKKSMALMVVSVAVGTALAASLISISLEISGKVSRELRSFGANILVEPKVEGLADLSGQKRFLRENEITSAKTIFWRNNILGIAPFLDTKAELDTGSDNERLNVSGVWHSKELPLPGDAGTFQAGTDTVFTWWQVDGKWPATPNAAAAGSALAVRLGIKKGDTITLDGKDFVVSGIFETGGDEDDRILMDLRALQKLKGLNGKVSRVFVSSITKPMDEFAYRDPEGMTQVEYEKWYCTGYVTTISAQLEEVFTGSTAKPVWNIAQTEGRLLGKLDIMIYLLTFIVLISAALGVSAAMIMSLLRRVQEIGLMKALGADNHKILIIFISEGVLVGVIGGLMGYILSIFLTKYIGTAVFSSGFERQDILLPFSIGSAVVISVAGTLLPLNKALRIKPGVVLKGAE